MRRSIAAVFLFVAIPTLVGSQGSHPKYAPGQQLTTAECDDFDPPKDPEQWVWADRYCVVRTRAELVAELDHHKLWLRNWSKKIDDFKAARITEADFEASGALKDPLRADLSGANLSFADLSDAALDLADLSRAILLRANLTNASIQMVDLTGASLVAADLTHAWIQGADLTGAFLLEADLTGTVLEEADLTGANFAGAYLSGALLSGADLTSAYLGDADLTGTYLRYADLTSADLLSSDLTGAHLEFADLTGATCFRADFGGADLSYAWLGGAFFGPDTLPAPAGIALADGLDSLQWTAQTYQPAATVPMRIPGLKPFQAWSLDGVNAFSTSLARKPRKPRSNDLRWEMNQFGQSTQTAGSQDSTPGGLRLIDLSKSLKDAGYSKAADEVALAYHRYRENFFQFLFIDATCEWGTNRSRPFFLAFGLAVPFWLLIYWPITRFGSRASSIAFVRLNDDAKIRESLGGRYPRKEFHTPNRNPVGDPNSSHGNLTIESDARSNKVRTPGGNSTFGAKLDSALSRVRRALPQVLVSLADRLRWELRIFLYSGLFSLMSVLNLGILGLDVRKWVRLISMTDFDLEASGWIRVVSGIQSLICFSLLALWAFLKPFDFLQ